MQALNEFFMAHPFAPVIPWVIALVWLLVLDAFR